MHLPPLSSPLLSSPKLRRWTLSTLLCTVILPSAPVLAQEGGVGDLTVTPTRAIFEGRTRANRISLINRGTAAATYRISFVQLRMSEDGEFEEITEPGPGERFADEMIRYSPRQVILEPGVAQAVRLMLRKPADLPPGEYRSHLVLHAVPPEDAGTSIETVELEDEEFDIRLIPIFRISIPVIVRHGELTATAELADVAFRPATEETAPAVSLRLERHGERSLYGDVSVTFVPDVDGPSGRKGKHGPETVVGQIKGLAVYTPNPSRSLVLPLNPPEGVQLAHGRLKVAFSEGPDVAGAATSEAEVPPEGDRQAIPQAPAS